MRRFTPLAVLSLATSLLILACTDGSGGTVQETPASEDRQASEYEQAILDVDGVFFTEISFPGEDQIDRIWIDAAHDVSCKEVLVGGKFIAASLVFEGVRREIKDARPGSSVRLGDAGSERILLADLPHLDLLAQVAHEFVEASPLLILEARLADPEGGQELVSRVLLDPETLFPTRGSISRKLEDGTIASSEYIYENTQVLDGNLSPNSQERCRVD